MTGVRIDEEGGGVPVARLDGEIDLSNAEAMLGRLAEAVPNAASGLVIDLSGVSFLDSSAVGALFRLSRRLDQRRQQLRLVVPGDSPIMRVLELVDVEQAAPVHASVEEAVAPMRR